METTFISIIDLSPTANILYSSDSIIDILGYSPDDVLNKSCWDYFHPGELPVARATHDRGIQLDKASVLSYCRLKGKDGQWIGCEVVFTVVYDVIVGCTSIYRRGLKSQSRAIEAPAVRRLFSTSPRDPRYHMLSHLSTKFQTPMKSSPDYHERRSALFLNRYTRTLTIMYATEGLSEMLGISGEDLRGKSFYYCIQENCLKDAVRCLESAKANDSIAYLRFWYRDPRSDERHDQRNREEDSAMEDGAPHSEEQLDVEMTAEEAHDRQDDMNNQYREDSSASMDSEPLSSTDSVSPVKRTNHSPHLSVPGIDSRTSSDESNIPYSHEAVFGESRDHRSSASSCSQSPSDTGRNANGNNGPRAPVELEAVVSCTSDGLVVCLRRAAPLDALPRPQKDAERVPTDQGYSNGLFAVPWAQEPMLPTPQQRAHQSQRSGFAPSLTPAQAYHRPIASAAKPPQSDFMTAIRDCAVFAWALTGINGSLAEYSRGTPRGESQPSSGLPVWESDTPQTRQSLSNQRPTLERVSSPQRQAFPSPSSIATGSYFSKPSLSQNASSDYQRNSSLRSGSGSNRQQISSSEWTRQPSFGGSGFSEGLKRGSDPPYMNGGPEEGQTASHMVDGIDGAFDNQRDPFSPDSNPQNMENQPPSSMFDFHFNSQKAASSFPHKSFAGTYQRNGPPPIASNNARDGASRHYYDPARRDL